MSAKRQTGPVFVFGPLRSGAKLLALSLSLHPHLNLIEEAAFLGNLATGLRRAYVESSHPYDIAIFSTRRTEIEDFYEHFGRSISSLIGQVRPEQRWMDATWANALVILPLSRMFPDARFLIVTRPVDEVVPTLVEPHLRSVYRSRSEQFTPTGAINHWMEITQACLDAELALGTRTVMRIERDTLVHHPAETVERALGFLTEKMHPACLAPFTGIDEALAPPPGKSLGSYIQDGVSVELVARARALDDRLRAGSAATKQGDFVTELRLEAAFNDLADGDLPHPVRPSYERSTNATKSSGQMPAASSRIVTPWRRFKREFDKARERQAAAQKPER